MKACILLAYILFDANQRGPADPQNPWRSQVHLLQCDDGHSYVVKFRNKPQHWRILVNEWLASAFLQYREISTPLVELVNLSAAFLESNSDVHIQLGSRLVAVESGWHFGSRYPGDPGKVIVYDFIPDLLLDQVANHDEFLGVLAFDKWIGNADAHESIFSAHACSPGRRPNGIRGSGSDSSRP
jgi:hypothetical protein